MRYEEVRKRWKPMVAVGASEMEELMFRSVVQNACRALRDHGHVQGSYSQEVRHVVELMDESNVKNRFIILNPWEESLLRCCSISTGRDIPILSIVSGNMKPQHESLLDLSFDQNTKRRTYRVFSDARAYLLLIARKTAAEMPITTWDDDTEIWPDHEFALEVAIQGSSMIRRGNREDGFATLNAAYTLLESNEKRQQAGTVVTPQLGFPGGLAIEHKHIL